MQQCLGNITITSTCCYSFFACLKDVWVTCENMAKAVWIWVWGDRFGLLLFFFNCAPQFSEVQEINFQDSWKWSLNVTDRTQVSCFTTKPSPQSPIYQGSLSLADSYFLTPFFHPPDLDRTGFGVSAPSTVLFYFLLPQLASHFGTMITWLGGSNWLDKGIAIADSWLVGISNSW